MVDSLGIGAMMPNLSKGFGYTTIAIGYILVAVFVLALIFFLWWYFSFNIKFRIRELTGDKTFIKDDYAKQIKTKDGIIKWKLRSRRHFVPVPPKESIHLTSRGRKSVEAYYTPEHEYKFILDDGITQIQTKEKCYIYLTDEGFTAEDIKGFRSINTNDREFYAYEERKAQKYRKKDWKEYIPAIAGIAGLVILVICVLVFWEDITKPSIEAIKTNQNIAQVQYETMVVLKDILNYIKISPNNQSMIGMPINITDSTGQFVR